MARTPPAQRNAEETRSQLLKAATASFAYDGFHATSLKQIARAAGVNPALIAYYFGNKEGLYMAVFEAIVGQIQAKAGPRVEVLQTVLDAGEAADPGALRQALYAIVDAMLELLSGEESREWALLITREQASPTDAFEIVYNGFMGKVLGLASRVIRELKPGLSDEQARLFAFTVMGQVLVFRVSRTAALRHMGWKVFGEAELEAAKEQVHDNITAWLAV